MSGFGTMKSDMDMCLMITEDGVCIVLCLYVHVLYTVKQPSFLTLLFYHMSTMKWVMIIILLFYHIIRYERDERLDYDDNYL